MERTNIKYKHNNLAVVGDYYNQVYYLTNSEWDMLDRIKENLKHKFDRVVDNNYHFKYDRVRYNKLLLDIGIEIDIVNMKSISSVREFINYDEWLLEQTSNGKLWNNFVSMLNAYENLPTYQEVVDKLNDNLDKIIHFGALARLIGSLNEADDFSFNWDWLFPDFMFSISSNLDGCGTSLVMISFNPIATTYAYYLGLVKDLKESQSLPRDCLCLCNNLTIEQQLELANIQSAKNCEDLVYEWTLIIA
jgi:hypothetical protein